MKNYLHAAVIKKDLTRFAPLWGLYTVFMLIFLLLFWENAGSAAVLFNRVPELMTMMGIVNFCYGGICAFALFGDLFTPKQCHMLHAMPVCREGWFLSHLVSGLSFCLIPSVLGTAIAALLLGQYAYGALLWLALTVMEFLFFFGVGTFSVMCAGTRLGAAAAYFFLHFFSLLLGWFADTLCEPLLYGVTVRLDGFSPLYPLGRLTAHADYLVTHYDNMQALTVLDSIPVEDWVYAGVTAAVGIALLGASLVLYRKRHLEAAGDMIAFPFAASVLLTAFALCAGLCLYTVGNTLKLMPWLLLFVGLAIGFFTGRMLLEKRIKVFRGKNFLGFGALVLSVAAVLLLVKVDVLGITRYVPEASKVESVALKPNNGLYYESWYPDGILTEPGDVEAVIGLHEAALKDRPRDGAPGFRIFLKYRLKSGTIVERSYKLPERDQYRALLHSIHSRPEYVTGTADMEALLEKLYAVEASSHEEIYPRLFICNENYIIHGLYGEQMYDKHEPLDFSFIGSFVQQPMARGLVEAIYADCEAGTMSQRWNASKRVGRVWLSVMEDGEYKRRDIDIYENCENTLTYLKSLQPEDP